ncbi:MAG: hypothetical protein JW895_05875 [Thermoleophilaceae bacterium]|nr:hypothetical protein [Thermoleophilaceae bacterium]
MFTMNAEELIRAAGGLDEDGTLRLPETLWSLLAGAPAARVFAADRRTVVGEIRMAPNGAAVYHCAGEGYSLLSPEELEELLRAVPVGVR